MDDFTPSSTWPPTFAGQVDEVRHGWLTHPDLLATELRTEPTVAALIAGRRPGS